jgi:hypothetical protein
VLRYDRTEHPAAEIPREERGKAALTELFEYLRGEETPIIVENVVNEVDEVVRAVRFEGWQNTDGDRLVQQALRKTLYIKFKIRDNDVFERALGYIREYYRCRRAAGSTIKAGSASTQPPDGRRAGGGSWRRCRRPWASVVRDRLPGGPCDTNTFEVLGENWALRWRADSNSKRRRPSIIIWHCGMPRDRTSARLGLGSLISGLDSFEDARHLDISAARGGSPESVFDGWLRLLEAREDLARGEMKSLRYRTELLHPLRSAAEFGKGFHGALRQLRQLGGLGPESHGVHLRHFLVRRDLGFPGLRGGLRGVQGDPRGGV